MKKEEALQIIKNVCAVYRGTLQEHVKIQDAIKIIEKQKDEKNK
jgi:hypothetical protein